jgi:hypothetical protein
VAVTLVFVADTQHKYMQNGSPGDPESWGNVYGLIIRTFNINKHYRNRLIIWSG